MKNEYYLPWVHPEYWVNCEYFLLFPLLSRNVQCHPTITNNNKNHWTINSVMNIFIYHLNVLDLKECHGFNRWSIVYQFKDLVTIANTVGYIALGVWYSAYRFCDKDVYFSRLHYVDAIIHLSYSEEVCPGWHHLSLHKTA